MLSSVLFSHEAAHASCGSEVASMSLKAEALYVHSRVHVGKMSLEDSEHPVLLCSGFRLYSPGHGIKKQVGQTKMIAVQILRSDFASGMRPLAEWAWDVQATCAQHVCIYIYIYPHDTRTRQQLKLTFCRIFYCSIVEVLLAADHYEATVI